jgi:hypothetical protein
MVAGEPILYVFANLVLAGWVSKTGVVLLNMNVVQEKVKLNIPNVKTIVR